MTFGPTVTMSFSRRNVGVKSSVTPGIRHELPNPSSQPISGVRPSPIDGRLTTSTGTQTLDELMAGHGGLPLGSSLLIEENGSTDFAGTLLRFHAAEGLVQGHQLHLVGAPDQWSKDLPDLIERDMTQASAKMDAEDRDQRRMKIAWRYEHLGTSGAGARGPPQQISSPSPESSSIAASMAFCHSFDLTKRLDSSAYRPVHHLKLPVPAEPASFSFEPLLRDLSSALTHSPPNVLHRLIVPTLLSPISYSAYASDPKSLFPFLHGLKRLLRCFPHQLTAVVTLPLSLYPRSQGFIRWTEHLMDGVLELAPFPSSVVVEPPLQTSSSSSRNSKADEKPQGMVKIHKLPALTEKGRGSGAGNDLAFSLGKRRFVIAPYHLPPEKGDESAQTGEGPNGAASKAIDF